MKGTGRAKILAAVIWLGLLAVGIGWGHSRGYGLIDLTRLAYAQIAQHPYAPFVYIVLYTLRPLVFFPAMWLTILSGSLFGFWGGVFYTVIGENLSASLAYFIGRFLTPADSTAPGSRLLSKWRSLLDEQAFTSVLILRLIHMPFDLVNYGCGLLAVRWAPYALATLIGIMPGLVTLTSIGASVNIRERLQQPDMFSPVALLDGQQLLISGALLILSLIVARVVHLRHRQRVAPVILPP